MGKISCPPFVQWEVTEFCNHNCIHCYNHWRTDSQKLCLSAGEDKMNMIAERLISLHPISVTFTGGEPLIIFSQIRPIMKKMYDAGINVSINTNARLINQEMCVFLSSIKARVFVSFLSSNGEIFDKIANTNGALLEVTKAIKMLKQHNVHVGANMVLSKTNLPSFAETIQYIHSLGISSQISLASLPINAHPLFSKQLIDVDDWNFILDICSKLQKEKGILVSFTSCMPECAFQNQQLPTAFHRNGCFAGIGAYAVDIQGNIKACARDSTIYGNILLNDFDEIYDNMKAWRDESMIPEECDNCKLRHRCRGGCKMMLLSTPSKKYTLPNICDINRKSFINAANPTVLVQSNDIFELNKNAIFFQEKTCVRIQVNNKCTYVSQDFFDWLTKHPIFTYSELQKDCKISEERIKRTLYDLMAIKILFKR